MVSGPTCQTPLMRFASAPSISAGEGTKRTGKDRAREHSQPAEQQHGKQLKRRCCRPFVGRARPMITATSLQKTAMLSSAAIHSRAKTSVWPCPRSPSKMKLLGHKPARRRQGNGGHKSEEETQHRKAGIPCAMSALLTPGWRAARLLLQVAGRKEHGGLIGGVGQHVHQCAGNAGGLGSRHARNHETDRRDGGEGKHPA